MVDDRLDRDHTTAPAGDRLLTILAEVLDVAEPVPGGLVDAAVAHFDRRDLDVDLLDVELLALLADSADAAVAVRADELRWRLVVFEGRECTVEVEVDAQRDHVEVIGCVSPAGRHTLRADHGGATTSAVCDDDGRFRLSVPARTLRLRVDLVGGGSVVTPEIRC